MSNSRVCFESRSLPKTRKAKAKLMREAARICTSTLRSLRGWCWKTAKSRPPRCRLRLRVQAVYEAFPNLFLGVLCAEPDYPVRPSKGRCWTDCLFPLVASQLDKLIQTLLPQRRFSTGVDAAVTKQHLFTTHTCSHLQRTSQHVSLPWHLRADQLLTIHTANPKRHSRLQNYEGIQDSK